MEIINVVLVVIISYLLGSVPTAYLIAKFNKVNIFDVGSGNMGATNVIRAVGLMWGLLVFLLDAMKGIAAILLARHIMSYSTASATTIAALVAIIGHNWSVFATLLTGSLRGGKGAATAFGTLLMIAPFQVLLVTCAMSGAIIAVTRYMSLGVLVLFAFALAWLLVLISQNQLQHEFIIYCLTTAVLIIYRFRENIQRLLTGKERRLGEPA
jgi:acyl phosphate:glycerol-3-phosphate acyltransferase